MASSLEAYKCLNCGGVLSYDPEWEQYGCASCGSFFDIEQYRPKTSQMLYSFRCSECGAELVFSREIASFTCPYCSNNEIVPSRFGGKFSPDAIIPFEIDKEEAQQKWKEHALEKPWLPDDYFDNGRLVSAEGVYVPFWLFSGAVDYNCLFKGIVQGDGYVDTIFSQKAGAFKYRRIPADASIRMPNDMMDSLMRYRLGDLQPFTTDCMPGFVAERYTEKRKDSWERIKELITDETKAFALRNGTSESFEDPKCVRSNINIVGPDNGGIAEQVLYPVWLFSYEYGGERQLVGVNGQTGIVAANYPVDAHKVAQAGKWHSRKTGVWSALAAMGVFAGFNLLLIGGFTVAVLIAAVVAIIGLLGALLTSAGSGVDVGDLEGSTTAMENVRKRGSILGFIDPNSIELESDSRPLTSTSQARYSSTTRGTSRSSKAR